MPNQLDRRSFLQKTALAGAALAAPGILSSENTGKQTLDMPGMLSEKPKTKLNIGFIGTGLRGQNHVELALLRDDCEILAIADPDPRMVADTLKMIAEKGRKKPDVYGNGDRDYLKLLEDKNIDAVVIASPWEWHTEQCVAAMQAGKYVGSEVGGGFSLDE